MPARRKSTVRKSEIIESTEERTFVNPSAVSPHLSCPICQEVFVNPQRAPCGHTFCRSCILPWISTNPVCPVDRKPTPKDSLYHDFLIENIIGDYMVACPWRPLGCDFVGPLHMLQSHKKACFMNPDSLPPALRAHATAQLSSQRHTTGICAAPCQKKSPDTVTLNSNNTNSALGVVHGGGNCSGSVSPAASTSQPLDDQESVLHASDEEHLPPTPPPNLLLRLYHNSDQDSRNLLCNFLDNSPVASVAVPPNKRRRKYPR